MMDPGEFPSKFCYPFKRRNVNLRHRFSVNYLQASECHKGSKASAVMSLRNLYAHALEIGTCTADVILPG
jgi:hypothetical protein